MITTAFLNCIMGNVFGTDKSVALPTEYYLGLSMSEPQLDGTGVTEPSAASYSRVKLTNLSAPIDGRIQNSSDVFFAETTEDWGTITHYVFFPSAEGSTFVGFESLTKPKTVQSESQVRFKAGTLQLSLKNKVDSNESI